MYQNHTNALAWFGEFGFLLIAAMTILTAVIYWRIAVKAGYNGAMSLWLFVPIINFIVILVFAFTEWPIEQELSEARRPRLFPPY